jgi:hypothetical protein
VTANGANVVPFGDHGAAEEWADVAYKIPAPLPHIPPAAYQARSVALKRRDAFKRSTLVLEFDVYRGDYMHNVVLAPLPMYVRLPGAAGVSPHSKLARLFHVFYFGGQTLPRWGSRLPLNVLKNKLWRVEVADADQDSEGRDLPEATKWSVVVQVLERLA